MHGLPEQGKAARAIDAALDHILKQRRQIVLEETERASTDWVLMYVSALIDTMVHAPQQDRERFAHEIHDVIVDMGIAQPEVKVIARPADIEPPPAEGEWLETTAEHVGED
jgi:hypothetical protein